jgi:hypothetical protein
MMSIMGHMSRTMLQRYSHILLEHAPRAWHVVQPQKPLPKGELEARAGVRPQ